MNNLVTIRTFTYAHEAVIVKARLEAEGVQGYLKDEFTVSIDPFLSNAVGGVKLQVVEDDVDEALAILTKVDYTADEHPVESVDLTANDNRAGTPTCPSCGSSETAVQRRPAGWAFGISVLLLGFPIPFLSKSYHCFNCGIDFKEKK